MIKYYSLGFWRWCITFELTQFLDLFHLFYWNNDKMRKRETIICDPFLEVREEVETREIMRENDSSIMEKLFESEERLRIGQNVQRITDKCWRRTTWVLVDYTIGWGWRKIYQRIWDNKRMSIGESAAKMIINQRRKEVQEWPKTWLEKEDEICGLLVKVHCKTGPLDIEIRQAYHDRVIISSKHLQNYASVYLPSSLPLDAAGFDMQMSITNHSLEM